MTVEELFGLAVRLFGLIFIGFGLFNAFQAVATAAGLPLPSAYPVTAVLAGAALWLVLGLILFVGADAITRFAYRKRPNPN